MTEETKETAGRGVEPIFFWVITVFWIGPWIEALHWIFRHWAGLTSHGHYVWFAMMYPMPWVAMVADRKRKDITVLMVTMMAYFLGAEAVAIICQ